MMGAEFVFEASLFAAVAEPETGGGVNPMPALDFQVLAAPLLRLAPVVALAHVPGIDLDDQRKGFGRLVLPGGELWLAGATQTGASSSCRRTAMALVALALGFAGQGAAAQAAPGHPQANGLGLLGRHLGDEQGAHLLHQGRGGRVLPQPQHPVGGKVPVLAVGAPAVGAEQLDLAAIGVDPPGHAALLVGEACPAVGALLLDPRWLCLAWLFARAVVAVASWPGGCAPR